MKNVGQNTDVSFESFHTSAPQVFPYFYIKGDMELSFAVLLFSTSGFGGVRHCWKDLV